MLTRGTARTGHPGESLGGRAKSETSEASVMEARGRIQARGIQALDGRTANSGPLKSLLPGLHLRALLLQGLERGRQAWGARLGSK